MVNQNEEKLVNAKKVFITLGLLLAFGVTLPSARADENDQATKLTFNQAVQIPGHVLPAGTYWFMLTNTQYSRNIVAIYNANRSTVIATVLTVDTRSATAPDQTAVTFAAPEPMQPQALLSWFYPGDPTGHQFMYSSKERMELARVKHYTVMAKTENKRQTSTSGD
jgi:hypothetical protein